MYVYTSFNPAGGAGAVYGLDGYQCACDMGALGLVGKANAEEEMDTFPRRVAAYKFLIDSAGAGKWRGAPGTLWEGINRARWYTQGPGQQGGGPTPFNTCYVLSGSKRLDVKHPHVETEMKAGDSLFCRSGGGAGIGRPYERDPDAVRSDVKNELVSLLVLGFQ